MTLESSLRWKDISRGSVGSDCTLLPPVVDLLTFMKHLRTGGSKIKIILSITHQIYTGK